MSAIDFENVSVHYGLEPVLESLSFTVESGSWVSVIGPNGAGKSTMLRALVGLTPFSGSIAIAGRSVERMRRRELARALAYVPQTPEHPAGMSVFDYVMLGRTPHRSYLGSGNSNDLAVVRDILALLDLERLARRPVSSVSGGEAQRAAIARAVAQQAPVLLLDEPTSSLDIARQQEVMNLIDGLRSSEGLTVISTMHDLTLAGQYADRLLLLADGTVRGDGISREVLTTEAIERHYGAYVRVVEDDDGAITVVPLRPGRQAELDEAPSER
ncbi:MAG: ABC transporter ATP-binding protein [Acidimicrobiia bacterium]|nr:ABC transporter ATP-binding protein [Acidimicrobiia bacterium]